MQLAASDALDLSNESSATKEMYGLNDERTASYGRRCLMARRLVERGVRMVQLYIERQIWDNHQDLVKDLSYACGKTDKPIAALLSDLKQRGLLDSTLLIWGGEFGRLPLSQSRGANRDVITGLRASLCARGRRSQRRHGLWRYRRNRLQGCRKRVSVHDFHATILHQLGLNHRDLVFEREGRNERPHRRIPRPGGKRSSGVESPSRMNYTSAPVWRECAICFSAPPRHPVHSLFTD